jgi:hypothetical protein
MLSNANEQVILGLSNDSGIKIVAVDLSNSASGSLTWSLDFGDPDTTG